MSDRKRNLRCAIYTRKSHEEGLEQEFNSLDAQRDAAIAYIKSQKHEGWTLVKKQYNDGGYSGGTVDRPALTELLRDVKDNEIDIIIVYKVDRLSRSIHDFAGLMKEFDKHNVSFVSVTQQFNTTSSMGRLTLNILLSFAQFEREVTGERIRDKIAASKKKGYWMGGTLPLGYRVEERRLKIIQEEAKLVTKIFSTYIETGSLIEVCSQLNQKGYRTKQWASKSNKQYGNKPLTPKYVYRILVNPVYIGKIKHKENVYNGLHKAIIDTNLWSKVHACLKKEKEKNKQSDDSKTILVNTPINLLQSKLYTHQGFLMSPDTNTENNKPSKKYSYYVSQRAIQQGYKSCDIGSINTKKLDNLIIKIFMMLFGGWLSDSKEKNFNNSIHNIIEKVVLSPSHIKMTLNKERVESIHQSFLLHTNKKSKALYSDYSERRLQFAELDKHIIIEYNISLHEIKRPRKYLTEHSDKKLISSVADSSVIQAVGRAYGWLKMIREERINIAELARRTGFNRRYIERILTIIRLRPDLLEKVLDGSLHLTVNDLLKISQPFDWKEQFRIYQGLKFENADSHF